MKSCLAFLICLLSATAGFGQTDAIDIHAARIVNAPPAASWPITTSFSRIQFDGCATRVSFTKQDSADRWPDVTPAGWDGSLQYTLWLFRQINGQWAGSAFVQMWHGRDGTGSCADPDVPSKYNAHWYYDQRWAPLYGSGPIVAGETIGFMVSAGNARDSGGPFGAERSNIVTFKAADQADYFDLSPAPVPTPQPPAPTPVPTPQPQPPAVDLSAVLARLSALEADVKTLQSRLGVLEGRSIAAGCEASIAGIPIHCALR